uniref:Uncharacterized protein n=1 Tax=Alexandrium catenella TaxID=2925 RepID=A0A7S1PY99_ALECA
MRSLLAAACLAAGALAQYSDIYNQPPDTVNGCECKSSCKVDLRFHCNVAPLCEVYPTCRGGKIAEWSWSKMMFWDYCVYNKYSRYEDLPAASKKDMLLRHVREDSDPSNFPHKLQQFNGLLRESVAVSFDSVSDVFPEPRGKWIHNIGVTGGIRFIGSGNHHYTGLFKGAEHGIIRLSVAKPVNMKEGVAPGMGIKFLRDGRPSANFVAMFTLDGQPSHETNFFQHAWSNHIPQTDDFGLKLVAAKFFQGSYCPLMVGLSDLSTDAAGRVGAFPFQLTFHPLRHSDCPCDDFPRCLANVARIPVGARLFEVRAVARPGAAAYTIGHIELTEKLRASKFGDEHLFFKHQRMEEDFRLHPDWLDAISKKRDCGLSGPTTSAPAYEKGCHAHVANLQRTNVSNLQRTKREAMLDTDKQVII